MWTHSNFLWKVVEELVRFSHLSCWTFERREFHKITLCRRSSMKPSMVSSMVSSMARFNQALFDQALLDSIGPLSGSFDLLVGGGWNLFIEPRQKLNYKLANSNQRLPVSVFISLWLPLQAKMARLMALDTIKLVWCYLDSEIFDFQKKDSFFDKTEVCGPILARNKRAAALQPQNRLVDSVCWINVLTHATCSTAEQ